MANAYTEITKLGRNRNIKDFNINYEEIYIPNPNQKETPQNTFRLVVDQPINTPLSTELERMIKKVSVVDPELANQLTEDDLDFIDSNTTNKYPDDTDDTKIEEELFGNFDEFDLLDFDINNNNK